ncbi:CHAT domain-containing protein [Plantactinospora sp. KLBMP9567]|uniref:CHAT domain-containing protein n=1 Tax=Plantactinospora sp. KLBMP9567 TaxID=3085900 RepID=UPI002980DB01|nr:CHAT domain-containing protein [Plantactinospora sp. KLBMP9567]MDW5327528.1 CHAT domain-containing protein [Plantactinospora sp. KLBMP9567]
MPRSHWRKGCRGTGAGSPAPLACYVGRLPDGRSGADGPGTRTDLLDWLGDAGAGTMMHLACHGMVGPGTGTAATSYLLLANGERLAAEELVRSSAGRPVALAVPAACSSGVCGRGDDEAFSISTTLLANNVRTVVAAQWSVPDAATSVLMFMFHHFLRVQGRRPADALREAQLWMLSEHREVPAEMPPALRDALVKVGPAGTVEWGAFIHSGR